MWAVGTMKHLVLLDVSCTKLEDTWSECGFCLFFWGRKNVSVGRAGIDPLTVRYINFNLWSRCLCSNVPRLVNINISW